MAVGVDDATGAPIYEDPVTGEDLPLAPVNAKQFSVGSLAASGFNCTVYVADPVYGNSSGPTGLRVQGSSYQTCAGTYGTQHIESRVQRKVVRRYYPDGWETRGATGSAYTVGPSASTTGFYTCQTTTKKTWRTVGTGTARGGAYGASARSDEISFACN